MSDVSVKTCPSCGGRLVYQPESSQMKCDFCGSFHSVESVSADTYSGQAPRQEENAFERELAECTCQSCGARVCAQNEVISLGCPYCNNPLIINSRVSRRFKPDGIIPFAFSADEAMRLFRNYTQKLWFVPKELKQNSKPDDFRAMYAPFFLFDFDVSGEVGKKGQMGQMEINKLPIDASTNFPDDLMDTISPYDYQKMRPFSSDFLRGFLGETYNENSESFMSRANQMVQETFDSYIALQQNKMPGQVNTEMSLKTRREYYVLLPVYLFSVVHLGKKYYFAVNGQTGKVAGNLPYEKQLKHMSKIMALIAWLIFGMPVLGVAIFLLIGAIFRS